MAYSVNDLYNERVRQTISDEYVSASKRKQEKLQTINSIKQRLHEGKDTIPYSEYNELKTTFNALIEQLHDLEIEIDTWDKAREVCLNVAEDISKRRKE